MELLNLETPTASACAQFISAFVAELENDFPELSDDLLQVETEALVEDGKHSFYYTAKYVFSNNIYISIVECKLQ